MHILKNGGKIIKYAEVENFEWEDETIKKVMNYSPRIFGIKSKSQGYKSKLCIVGCGVSGHEDINDPTDIEVLLDGCKDPNDNLGLSTMHAGVA